MKKIYLAGPEVFLPNAVKILESNKNLCKQYGFEGIAPFDLGTKPDSQGLEKAKAIFQNNKSLIQESDFVLANCNPFRGACVDDGTSWEIGFACANQKKIYGYCSHKIGLVEITKSKISHKVHSSGYFVDEEGYLLNEDFGNTINLMLEFSIAESGGRLVEGSFSDALKILSQENST